MPKTSVDILLPYWGDFGLFKKAVDSVLTQTNPNWQLLIFDDHYPSEEAEKYCTSLRDPRVIYHRHKENIGITNNFNFALAAAHADYCVMLGCDDILLPRYIETALQNIGDADFYQPGVDVINSHDKIHHPIGDRIKSILQPKKTGKYFGESLAASLCHGNWLYFPSIMWKTSTIKKYGFDKKYKIVEDLALELNIIKDGAILYFDKHNTTFQYRRFADSLSSREKAKDGVRFSEETAVYDFFSNTFSQIGWKRAARAARWHITSRIHKIIS